ncbi:MAG TPA: FAD-dependent monooxygenase [Candidatus Baltobacteraceae bacterium]|nr:FAD-dependent monooxygenase [Candidatus Baltobacteraceae bacterium]
MTYDVVIAGAGPVGLFLAAELRRRGCTCLIVERNVGPSKHSKALGVMPRTLESLALGGIDSLAALANPVRRFALHSRSGTALVRFDGLPTPYPYVAIVPQSTTESVLAEAVRSRGAEIRYGVTLSWFREENSRVVVDVRAADGTNERHSASYLVGCDGAHSTVRELTDIPFVGEAYPEGAILADLPMRTSLPLDQAELYLRNDGLLTMFPISRDVRRIVVVFSGGVKQEMTRAWFQEQLDTRGVPATLDEPLWVSAFHVHRRRANVFAKGRVFLAGDAAHIHSPAGGQGMNTGLGDAFNLAWKIAWVCKGRASAGLLATYECERLPIALSVLRTTNTLTQAIGNAHAFCAMSREIASSLVVSLPFVQHRLTRRLAGLDLEYPRGPLTRGRGMWAPSLFVEKAAELSAILVDQFAIVAEARADRTLPDRSDVFRVAAQGRERVCLVRPDGYVAYRADVTDWSRSFDEIDTWREGALRRN